MWDKGRLALSDIGMSVMWVSKENAGGDVKYGVSEAHLSSVSVAKATTYGAEDMCGLRPTYRKDLRVRGSFGRQIWTCERYLWELKFTTVLGATMRHHHHPRARLCTPFSTESRIKLETTFIGYGDMGSASEIDRNSTSIILSHLSDVDFVLHVGDISYAQGRSDVWNRWFEEIEPIATAVPYHVCLGNHEYDDPKQRYKPWFWTFGKDSGGECGVPFDRRFNMPGPKARDGDLLPGSTNIFHSRNVGLVHFVVISSEHNASVGSEQIEWLVQDLQSVNRTETPWIVFGHRPFYDNSVARFLPEDKAMRNVLEGIMIKFKVDLVLFGHIHQYQRTCRMKNFKCDERGPVYMVVGTAGATYQVPFMPQAKWIMKQSYKFGIPKFKANHTHMRVTWTSISTAASVMTFTFK